MSNYEIPSWAGKPPTGLHLDVVKEGKLIQKLMIDDKRCYLFGRNAQLNDFCIDHGSCSRVHAALVYHSRLNRAFLVDLASTHGTYIGNVRLEGHKPTQLPIDSKFSFGASTRGYIIRERPQAGPRPIMEEIEKSAMKSSGTDRGDGNGGGAGVGGDGSSASQGGRLLGLPETETDLDDLTEFNTAKNRRVAMLGIAEDSLAKKRPRRVRITFQDEEEIINPEDVDPTVGRFRNMIETTVIPKKRPHDSLGLMGEATTTARSGHDEDSLSPSKRMHKEAFSRPGGLYDGLDGGSHYVGPSGLFGSSLSSRLGIPLPNPAPEVEDVPQPAEAPASSSSTSASGHPAPAGTSKPLNVSAVAEMQSEDPDEPKKKKYAKEAWPGRKPNPSLLG